MIFWQVVVFTLQLSAGASGTLFLWEEMVVYESLEDAVEKCNFYLSNQELRGKIARKGRERVLTEHNMVDKIRYMMDVAEV